MPSAEARVETDRASRYLVQLCSHASQMGKQGSHRVPAALAGHTMPSHMSAEWSDTQGTIRVDGGTCTVTATADALAVHVDATGTEELQRIQDAITRDLTRFSRRDPLTIDWTPGDGDIAPASPGHTPARRHRTILLVAVGILAIAAHVVAVVLSAPQWTGWAADVVLVVVIVKAVAVGGHFALRRRARRRRTHQA